MLMWHMYIHTYVGTKQEIEKAEEEFLEEGSDGDDI